MWPWRTIRRGMVTQAVAGPLLAAALFVRQSAEIEHSRQDEAEKILLAPLASNHDLRAAQMRLLARRFLKRVRKHRSDYLSRVLEDIEKNMDGKLEIDARNLGLDWNGLIHRGYDSGAPYLERPILYSGPDDFAREDALEELVGKALELKLKAAPITPRTVNQASAFLLP